MTPSGFSRVPTEVVESWAQYLEPSDLSSFRLECKQACAQTFQVVAQTFFSVWRTSLMGSDLRKLEEISMRAGLRKYVKTISIKDDGEIKGPSSALPAPTETPPITSLHIWPRGKMGMITSSEIGVENLRAMLLDKRLCPETIKIRDGHSRIAISFPAPTDALARDICDGADLAIISISFQEVSDSASEATISLSPQHQGQGVGFSLLRSAELRLLSDVTSFWSEQVLYHAPILENLKLTYYGPFSARQFDTLLSAGSPSSHIKQLSLFCVTLSARTVLTILGNSKYSLTGVSFNRVILQGSTWHKLLSSIGSDFPELTSFNLKFLSEMNGKMKGNFYRDVNFRGLSKDGIAEEYRSGLELFESAPPHIMRNARLRYKGPGAGGILKIVAASAVVNI